MKQLLEIILVAVAATTNVPSQPLGSTPTEVEASPASAAPVAAVQAPVLIRRDTPVVLMAISEVSTATAAPGTRIKLRVQQPLLIDGRTIVPVGTPAFGTVVAADDSGGLGKSGRMTARLQHIRLGDAEIPLDGEVSAKGTGAGSAGVAVIFTGVVGLFHRGNNAKIKAGEILSAFVSEDVMLDLTSNPIKRVAPTTSGAPQ
ncbi:hypothetical protein [Aquisediminimonas profunda]|uniref:hypothetical protein n=1 Tax=Aquisediminimonas profunda TaxID=1550733 RepID=UPI001C639883|nr:hypothetical protein [Aquisediminimonas profunda]